MPATKGASASAGASGRSKAAETNGKVKSVTFRGLKLVLPAKDPGEAFFTISEDELSESLKVFIGADQYELVRQKCVKDKLTMRQVVDGLRVLLTDCLEAYDLTSGE